MGSFRDKVVLITGAAGGFGSLLAERLAADGARLVLGDKDEDRVRAVADGLGGAVVARACDVSIEDEARALADAAVDAFGRLDIAINNAGLSTPMKSLLETTEADMDLNFAVNAKGVFFGMKHQIPHMLSQGGGTILNVASLAGINGAPKLAAYAASKHAVVGITKTAALEFARSNIRINAICPFYSPTPMVTESEHAGMQEFLAKGSPMKRLGDPSEIVNAMLLIVDPDNSYMTGQAIAVDGGVSAI